jgi:predicted extracellular nuclease
LNAASREVTFVITVGLSDAAKVDLDGAAIVIPAAVTEVSTLTLPATGSNGSAIVWASNDALINATTGAVTLPVSGTVTVTLTATLTLNAVVKDFTFNVAVGMPLPDLFISEYIEGSSNNKALEIYNGTGAAVDLSVYSIGLYSNGAVTGLFTTLSGTLAAGEVFVIANSAANAAILAQADLTFSYVSGQFGVNWNGDDAVALLKNGVVIDVFGVIGTDPGSFWPVNGDGDTVDNTLVRKSTVKTGVTTWDPAQWNVYAVDTTTYLGSHTMD